MCRGRLGWILLGTLLLSSAAHPTSDPKNRAQMQRTFGALLNLTVLASDSKRFADPSNEARIEKEIEVLSKFGHRISSERLAKDPGAEALAESLSVYLKDVIEDFKTGFTENTRRQVYSIANHCFACHARMEAQLPFDDAEKRIEKLSLRPFDMAQFLAATRQFDKALSSYRAFLKSTPSDDMAIAEYTRGLRRVISILVLSKGEAKATLALIRDLEARKDLPIVIRGYLSEWKRDAAFWVSDREPPSNSAGRLKKARTLIERADKMQSFGFDEKGDISYLRAVGYLQDAIRSGLVREQRSEALYLMGVCHSALQDPFWWDIDRVYYAACIRELPKSATAKLCFRRYTDRLYYGYSGTGGVFIPEGEQAKLNELRKLME